MKKAGLWYAAFIVIMIATAAPVQQTELAAGEMITRDIPHQY
jgi:hypothetical protein